MEKDIKSKKRKGLGFSFLDGIFASAMFGFTQDYFAPFLLIIGGTARAIGALNALPNLFASLVQLKSADFTERAGSRKPIINIFVFFQTLMLIPMAIMASIKWHSVPVFITIVVLFTSFAAFSGPAWASMMADLVDANKRGEYFGWRNKVLGFMLVGFTFIAGFILNKMKSVDVFYGFAVIFGCAFVFRIISWYFLTRMYEPELIHKKEDRFTLIDFLARIRESNFAKFVLFVAALNFSVNLASPFFTVLMLKDLHFNYLLYTLVTIAATLTIYFTINRWGRHADKVGNLRVLKFTAPIIAVIPLLWIVNRHPVYLVFAQVISGFAWAGFNLCASNFIYDAVTPAKRTRCIAYFNVLNGLALCAGALLGGYLVDVMPPLLGYNILSLFLISSSLRLIVAFFGPIRLKEVRPVENISSYQLFSSMVGVRPFLGVTRNVSYAEDR